MNMKSYFRGIGAGIIVAAIVMGVSSSEKTMTEAEIIASAKQLGMVESSTLLELDTNKEAEASINNTSAEDADTTASSISKEDNTSSVSLEENDTSLTESESKEDALVNDDKESPSSLEGDTSDELESPMEETSDSNGEQNNDTDKEQISNTQIDPFDGEAGFSSKEEYVEVKVIRGDSSVSVARRMFEAGLVESAVDFDKYLCSNGYDKSISVGTYEIPYGLDFESMAKIITRKN